MQTGRQGQVESGLQPGATLQNRYQIAGVLGVGGMGSVYRARDLRFPNVTKQVAVKEILNLAPDPTIREMIVKTFEREANILATLSHPAIPQIYDYFTQGDRSFLVQEYIEGKNLETYLADEPGLLSEDLVADWTVQLCDVLSYLHSHEPDPIVFRDLKPSNVMLDQHHRIRLIDFGIARAFAAGQKGTMIGTEGYSPPEQYRGEASPPGDIYALGATLHHLLTKQDPRLEPPFSFAERPLRRLNAGVSAEFDAIVATALNYNPSERFGSAQAMKEAVLSLRRKHTGMLTNPFNNAPPAPRPANAAPVATPNALVPPTAAPVVVTPAAGPAVPGAGLGEVAPIWRFKCEDEVRGTPLLTAGLVCVGAYDNNLYGISTEDGQLKWKYATDGGLPGSPVAFEDLILIGSEDQRLHTISARSGRIQWTYGTEGPIRSTPRVAEGHIFFGSDDGYLHAVNLQTGRRAWRTEAGAAVRGRPAVSSDRIFFGTEAGEFYALDYSGQFIWRGKAKRAITSSPLLHNGIIYFGSFDGQLHALEATNGWVVWKFRTGRAIMSSPELSGHLLYIGSADKNMYAVDLRSGREAWRYETGDQVNTSPAVYQNTVYFGSVDGCVYALDAANGRLRWKFRSGGAITSSPVIANGIVYIGSTDHYLYALSA
jgi:outer membrane protein assembly factor BamB/tRNA A-37 threonylcarbamoyl transferase component Bud32